jgi:two-component system nitrogen regulation response regulator NtrX
MPPLRERRDDIPMLIQHFTDIMTRREGMSPRSFETAAIDRLQALPWPGNVRELRNTVERLLILSTGDSVQSQDVELLAAGRSAGSGVGGELLSTDNFADFKEGAERAYILQKLRENDWNVAETARRIDMPRSNLYKKIERYELVREG